jgi:hypothetical protein
MYPRIMRGGEYDALFGNPQNDGMSEPNGSVRCGMNQAPSHQDAGLE